MYYSLVEGLEDVVRLFANLKLVHIGRDETSEWVPHHEELEAGWAYSCVKFGCSLWPEPIGSSVKRNSIQSLSDGNINLGLRLIEGAF